MVWVQVAMATATTTGAVESVRVTAAKAMPVDK